MAICTYKVALSSCDMAFWESFLSFAYLGGRPGRPRRSLIYELGVVAGDVMALVPLAPALAPSIRSVSLPLAAMLALMDWGADCFCPTRASSSLPTAWLGKASGAYWPARFSASEPGVCVAVTAVKRGAEPAPEATQLPPRFMIEPDFYLANSAHFCSDEPMPASFARRFPRMELYDDPELPIG